MIPLPAEALALAGLALMPLYSRIRPHAALDHETRGRLHMYLRAHPGSSRRELCAALDAHPMTLLHHLNVLASLGLVVARREGREVLYSLFDAPGAPPAALRCEPRRALVRALFDGARTQGDLSRATGLSQRLVAYHLARMEELVEGDGRRPRGYRLRDPARVLETLKDKSD